MITTLDHVLPHRREQIVAIAELLRAEAPVEMVILFGSHARGDAVEDFASGYVSDFDLLVVVVGAQVASDAALWERMSQRSRAIAAPIPVSLFAHDVKQINQEIRRGRYFYSDILREGVLLYDSRRVQLARPKAMNAGERLDIARRDFRYWFESASEFWKLSGFCVARGLWAHAAFLLHQACERYFHTVLLVFTGYKPKTHDIEELADQTAPLHPRLAGAMPRAEPADEELFKLLKRAYIEARYSKSYSITELELATLRGHVRDLAMRVRDACAESLASIIGAEAVGPLPAVPAADDIGEPPPMPALDDPAAVARWHRAIIDLSEARWLQGLREGEARGLREGELRGRASAVVDVLRRRGVELSEAEAERILACRDPVQLERWWDRAFTATTAADLDRA